MNSNEASGAGFRRAGLIGFFVLVVGTALVAGSCRSMSKPELERELLALGKNKPIRELQRRPVRFELEGGAETLDLVHVHAPAARADGPATPIVLVHGTPSTLFAWVELIHGGRGFEGLKANRDVYAIEVIGHGVAPGDGSPYTFERCAGFVVDAIRGLGLERVHLVGSSYGGEFVWRAALRAPELFESITLLDSSGYERREQDWLSEETVMRENSLAKIGWLLNSRERIEAALAPHFPAIPPDRVDEFFLVCENSVNWKAMIDLARDENGAGQDEIANLRVPALILWGADDIAYPPEVYAERFARDIPRAELVVLPDTGHYPHEQRPAEVIAVLEGFYDSLEARE